VTSRVVCDASAVVAVLLDDGTDGRWATEALRGRSLAAPALLPCETANIIRRQELAGLVDRDQAAQAHADLLDLSIEMWPYEPLAQRAWELRGNLSIYDAAYVALAELLDVTLVTLDRRMASAPGPRCVMATP
jgi:predicted nucleic acid-binding protein